MGIKEKIVDIFCDEYMENLEEDTKLVKKKELNKYYVGSCSGILNLIVNILYMNFVCYRGNTGDIGFYFFLFSFIWAIVSIVASYKLGDEKSNFWFYVNVLLLFFMSKMWFVYM